MNPAPSPLDSLRAFVPVPFFGAHPHAAKPDASRVGWLVLLLCLGQVLMWGVGAGLAYKAPELDSAEQFAWAFSLENGYWKHPPAPSWIMHALMWIFGPSVALSFVATQVGVVIALAITWRLGCEFMSPRRSLIAASLTSLVTYHNLGGDSFNHSTALLPFQAATVFLFYLATRRGAWHLWALAGLMAGLSMLVKYVAVIALAGMLVYAVLDRTLHHRRALLGIALAFGVFLVVLAPHAIWLGDTDFLPFRYAESVARPMSGLLSGLQSLVSFGLIQALRLSPMLLAVGYLLTRARAAPVQSAGGTPQPRDRLFLWVMAVSPIVLTLGFAIVTGTELQSRWGSNAFMFSGLLAMALVRRVDTASMLRQALRFAIAAHLVLCIGQVAGKTVFAEHFQRRTRANFPGALLARKAIDTWEAHTGSPLRIVASDIWLGGNIVANSPNRVAVLIDGHEFKSPWVTERAVMDCGALVLDDRSSAESALSGDRRALDSLMASASVTGTWELPWAGSRQAPAAENTGVVRWGIIAPRNSAECAME